MGGGVWVKTKNTPSDSRLKRGRGNRVVVWWVKTKNDPSDSRLKRGRGTGGGVVGEA